MWATEVTELGGEAAPLDAALVKEKDTCDKTEAKNRVFSVARSSFRDGRHGSGLAGEARAAEMIPRDELFSSEMAHAGPFDAL